MAHHEEHLDFGTGHKKLSVYSFGMAVCVILTVISFHAVMSDMYTRTQIIALIFGSAVAQFIVQIFCFLRLNIDTEQGVINMAALVYTLLILLCIVAGSLWIMANMNYYMMN